MVYHQKPVALSKTLRFLISHILGILRFVFSLVK